MKGEKFFEKCLKLIANFLVLLLKRIGSVLLSFIAVVIILSSIGVMIFRMIPQEHQTRHYNYMEIRLDHGLNEFPDNGFKRGVSLYNAIEAIKMAKEDPKIEKILLNLDYINLHTAQTEELIQVLENFKSEGKKVYAFGNYIFNGNYHLALVADKIYMSNSVSTVVNLSGYHISKPYFKEIAQKLGIDFHVINTGRYKTFGESYIRNKMSHAMEIEIRKIFDETYKNFVNDITKYRKIDTKKIKELISEGRLIMLSSKEAKKYKLIDELKYLTDIEDNLGEGITLREYIKAKHLNSFTHHLNANKIALIYASGEIFLHSSPKASFSRHHDITPVFIMDDIEKALDDKTVKGIIIRVDSPGGSALASAIISNYIKKAKKEKPIYISMGGVAASGGYYLSTLANKIFADKSTITGSIGVVTVFPTFAKLTKNIGVNFSNVSKGRHGDLFDLTNTPDEFDIKIIKNAIEKSYMDFKETVSMGRKMNVKDIEKIAQGKIWTGKQAKDIGLVDKIGGLDDTIKALASDYHVNNYSVITVKSKPNIIEILEEMGVASEKMNAINEIGNISEINKIYKMVKYLSYEPISLLDYDLEI